MYLILLIVNSSWGIVRQEDVNGGKSTKKFLNFHLLVEKVSSRFVSPRSVDAAENETAVRVQLEMQIHDGFSESRVGIVIAFDGKNDGASIRLRSLQDNLVGYITTRQDDIGISSAVFPVEVIYIREDQ